MRHWWPGTAVDRGAGPFISVCLNKERAATVHHAMSLMLETPALLICHPVQGMWSHVLVRVWEGKGGVDVLMMAYCSLLECVLHAQHSQHTLLRSLGDQLMYS